MKTKQGTVKLRLPADLAYLPVLQDFVGSCLKINGFTHNEILDVELGIEEAVTNVIEHAFTPSDEADFELSLAFTSFALEIEITEQGIPFDPESENKFSPDPTSQVEGINHHGLGIFLMRKAMDEVTFHNLGKKGKKLKLVKYRTHPAPEPSEMVKPESPQYPVEDIIIRRVKPEEAIKTARLLYNCYGYTYFYDRFYHPDQLARLWENKDAASIGAFTPDGEMIGHTALFRNECVGTVAIFGHSDTGRLAEPAAAVVHPAYRGHRLLPNMTEQLIAQARELFPDLGGLFTPPVTSHTKSQKSIYSLGFKDCGNLIGYYPPAQFKGIDEHIPQRISLVLTFRPIGEMKPRKVYAPGRHAAMIEAIFRNLGIEAQRILPPIDAAIPETSTTDISVHTVADLGNASIKIHSYGADTLDLITRTTKSLQRQGVEAILCYLSLHDPLTPSIAGLLEKIDYFFAGILPETSQGDSLLMINLADPDYDYDQIQLMTDKAKEYLRYIQEDMRRILKKAHPDI